MLELPFEIRIDIWMFENISKSKFRIRSIFETRPQIIYIANIRYDVFNYKDKKQADY